MAKSNRLNWPVKTASLAQFLCRCVIKEAGRVKETILSPATLFFCHFPTPKQENHQGAIKSVRI